MKTFLKPLTASEEARCIDMMQKGNGEEAAKAKELLIEHNLRLVAHIAKKYKNVDEDMEDLISIGTIGLIKAISSFDIKKGKLSTYASRCIDNELLMLLRAKKKTARDISLYEPIGTDKEGNEINLIDVIEQEQTDILERMEFSRNMKTLAEILKTTLDEREKEIIFYRYGLSAGNNAGKEMTQREIGKMLGISRSYVSRLESKALSKLRAEFEKGNQ